MQVLGLLVKPTYNETISHTYLAADQIEKYTIKRTEFMPFFMIIENGRYLIPEWYVYNSSENWDYYWA